MVHYVDGVSVVPARMGKGVESLKTLGIVRGFTAFDYLDKIKANTISTQENGDFAALLRTTLAGRNDGAYGNIAVVQYTLRETLREPGALVFDPALPHTKGAYHLSTLAHKDIIDAFNAWMKSNVGDVAKLKAKYQVE